MNKKIIIFVFSLFLSCQAFARGSSSAILVYPHFGLGVLSLGGSNDINDKILDIGDFVTTASKIGWSKSMGMMIGYRFKHRYSVGLIIDYTSASKFFSEESPTSFNIYHGSTTPVAAKYYEFNGGIKGTSLGAAFMYNIYSTGKLSLDLGLGILYAMSMSYYEDTTYSAIGASDDTGLSANLIQRDGSGKGFGFALMTSSSYYFTNYLGLGFDLSYRYLKSGGMKDANGNDLYFLFSDGTVDTSSPVSVNLSGLYLGLSLKVEFDLSEGTSFEASKEDEYKEIDDMYIPELASWDDTSMQEADDSSYVGPDPSLEELRETKRQVQNKWNSIRNDMSPDAKRKADRYRRLYDVVIRLERDWEHFSPKFRANMMEKIKTVISY
jgi:hypothetical protein